jgi:hypothetical protein
MHPNDRLVYTFRRDDGLNNILEVTTTNLLRAQRDSTDGYHDRIIYYGKAKLQVETSDGLYEMQVLNERIALLIHQHKEIEKAISKEAREIISFQFYDRSIDEILKIEEESNEHNYKRIKKLSLLRNTGLTGFLYILLGLVIIAYLFKIWDLPPLLTTRFIAIDYFLKYSSLFTIAFASYKFLTNIIGRGDQWILSELQNNFERYTFKPFFKGHKMN